MTIKLTGKKTPPRGINKPLCGWVCINEFLLNKTFKIWKEIFNNILTFDFSL